MLEELRKQFRMLNCLQWATLKRIVKLGDGTQPLSNDSVEYYRNETGNPRVTPLAVQKTLQEQVRVALKIQRTCAFFSVAKASP
jgi:hypothetical protein